MSAPLPFVDQHSVHVAAPRDRVWSALRAYVGGSLVAPSALTRLLGTDPPSGFEVADEVPPERLDLAGRHRFSRYLLRFELASSDAGTRLTASTFATFPGPRGRAYRLLVIDSRFHVVAVSAMLRSVRRASTR